MRCMRSPDFSRGVITWIAFNFVFRARRRSARFERRAAAFPDVSAGRADGRLDCLDPDGFRYEIAGDRVPEWRNRVFDLEVFLSFRVVPPWADDEDSAGPVVWHFAKGRRNRPRDDVQSRLHKFKTLLAIASSSPSDDARQ
jgi:hypothetical protein